MEVTSYEQAKDRHEKALTAIGTIEPQLTAMRGDFSTQKESLPARLAELAITGTDDKAARKLVAEVGSLESEISRLTATLAGLREIETNAGRVIEKHEAHEKQVADLEAAKADLWQLGEIVVLYRAAQDAAQTSAERHAVDREFAANLPDIKHFPQRCWGVRKLAVALGQESVDAFDQECLARNLPALKKNPTTSVRIRFR